MAIPALNLDDRTFGDMMEEVQALIPRYAPTWTNFNLSDPGITVMELFAWVTEAMLFRINRVPDASRRRFLELIGAVHQAAQPAILKLRVSAVLEPGQTLVVPAYTSVYTYTDPGEAPLLFETIDEVTFSADMRDRTLVVRQTTPVTDVAVSFGTGQPFQLARLPQPIALSRTPFPWPPRVLVDGIPWQYVPALRSSGEQDCHFTARHNIGAVIFGNGKQGMIPPAMAQIVVTYRTALQPQTIVRNHPLGKSSGRPNQVFRLPLPVLALDLQPPSKLEPQIKVDNELWEYCANILDFEPQLRQFTIEPWSDGLRFGDGSRGQMPPADAAITATYRTTRGRIPPLLVRTRFGFSLDRTTAQRLTVQSFTVVDEGAGATSLEDARQQAFALIKPAWRGITAADFSAVVMREQPDTHRVQCMPGDDLSAEAGAGRRPAKLGVLVTPRPRSSRSAAALADGEMLRLAPEGRSLVTSSPGGGVWLWDLESAAPPKQLSKYQSRSVAYSADGARIVLSTDDGSTCLYNAATGDVLCRLAQGDPAAPAGLSLLSSDGRRWLTAGYGNDTRALLRAGDDGDTLELLQPNTPIVLAAFTPDSTRIITTHAGAPEPGEPQPPTRPFLTIWDAENGSELAQLVCVSPVTRLIVSADSSLLASVGADHEVSVWDIAHCRELLTVALDAPVAAAIFSPNGKRLVTITDGGRARLWSVRTGSLVAALDQLEGIVDAVFSPDDRWLAAYNDQGGIGVWRAQAGKYEYDLAVASPVTALAFNATGSRLAAAGAGTSMLSVWDLAHAAKQVLAADGCTAVALNKAGRWAAWAQENLVSVWDMAADQVAAILHHSREQTGLRFIASLVDGDLLLTQAYQPDCGAATLAIWNAAYVDEVEQLLDTRHLLTSELHVRGPAFRNVCIRAVLVRTLPPKLNRTALAATVAHALYQFFDPLTGGPDMTGWPLGRHLYASEVYQVIEQVPGVDHVEALWLTDGSTPAGGAYLPRTDVVRIPPYHLINCVAEPGGIEIRDPEQMPFVVSA